MKKVALVLSGCGVYDGSEIHETTLAMLALSKNGVEYQCFAPNKKQHHVINHLTGEEMTEERNVLVESARIARGNIKPLSELKAENYDAVLLPGGYGAAKNLSNYAFMGENYSIDAQVAEVLMDFHKNKKPIAALCIAPVVVAKILKAKLTIGNDKTTAMHIEAQGACHVEKGFDEVLVDTENKVVTNPCYMLADSIYKVSLGADATVTALIELMD